MLVVITGKKAEDVGGGKVTCPQFELSNGAKRIVPLIVLCYKTHMHSHLNVDLQAPGGVEVH